MPRYFQMESNGEIDIIYEDSDGFEWVCCCGRSSHSQSKRTAELLVKLLNKNLKEK